MNRGVSRELRQESLISIPSADRDEVDATLSHLASSRESCWLRIRKPVREEDDEMTARSIREHLLCRPKPEVHGGRAVGTHPLQGLCSLHALSCRRNDQRGGVSEFDDTDAVSRPFAFADERLRRCLHLVQLRPFHASRGVHDDADRTPPRRRLGADLPARGHEQHLPSQGTKQSAARAEKTRSGVAWRIHREQVSSTTSEFAGQSCLMLLIALIRDITC